MSKTVIYTAIFNRYDYLRPATTSSAWGGYEWRVYGNLRIPTPQPWRWYPTECGDHPRLCARKRKILSPDDADVTIWAAGNIQLQGDLNELVGIAAESGIAVLQHSQRHCIYDEARACIGWKKDTRERIEPQMERYTEAGYPKDNGLSCHFVMVRHNRPEIKELENLWWHEVQNGSVRDQLSFDYCCWKLSIEPAIIPGDIFTGPHFKRFPEH